MHIKLFMFMGICVCICIGLFNCLCILKSLSICVCASVLFVYKVSAYVTDKNLELSNFSSLSFQPKRYLND